MMMELDDCVTESQNITKQDVHILSKITYDWSKTNFQVIDVTELCNVRFNNTRERITLIVNIKNQWNLLIKDEDDKIYLGYTDARIRDHLKQQCNKNKLKVLCVLKINNDGTSALIKATIMNRLLDDSKPISATVVKRHYSSEVKLELENCLKLIRGTRDKIKMLNDNNSIEVQHNQCSEKKVHLNRSADIKVGTLNQTAPTVSAAPQQTDNQARSPASLKSLIYPNQEMQFSEFVLMYQAFLQHRPSNN